MDVHNVQDAVPMMVERVGEDVRPVGVQDGIPVFIPCPYAFLLVFFVFLRI